MVGIAQLVRAPGCGPGGRRFESGYSPLDSLLLGLILGHLTQRKTLGKGWLLPLFYHFSLGSAA